MSVIVRRILDNAGYVVAAGFAVVLIVVFALIGTGLNRMAAMQERMDTIANVHNVKKEIITKMKGIVEARSLTMYVMYLMEDPFDRDEEFVHFNNLASEFIVLRMKLQEMELTDKESRLLERALGQIRVSAPLQAEIVDRIRFGDTNGIEERMIKEDLPLEKRILALFDRMVELERMATRESLADAQANYRKALWQMSWLAGMAVILTLFTAWFVIRRTSEIERDLFKEKEQAEVTLHAIGEGVITTDAKGVVRYLNPVAQQLTGWSQEHAAGRPLGEIYHVVDAKSRSPIDHPAMDGPLDGRVVSTQERSLLVSREDGEFAVEDSASPIRNDSGQVVGTVLVFRDVTQARDLSDQLLWQAHHDPLTGLANRRQFESLLRQMLESAKTMGKVHAVLYIDLDQFKLVNDTCGHVAGDRLLQELAGALQPCIRGSDTLARLGGDEFGVLLEGCREDDGRVIAEQILENIRTFRFLWNERSFNIGASIGLVMVDNGSGDAASVLSAADAACYIAKDKGRNRIWIHRSGDEDIERHQTEMELIGRITSAFEEGRFRLYKQAIRPLTSANEKGHYELLLRMIDRNGEVVTPAAFIPAAERYGVMPNIDRWVIRTAFSWLRERKDGLSHDEMLSINLSGQSLGDEQFLEFLNDQFASSGVEPHQICFEITETSAIAHWARATGLIEELRAKGCRLAFDDFGSGVSSFSYLKNLPVDYLKIDGSFVQHMLSDPVNLAVVESIFHIGRAMGVLTVAECVETETIRQRLKDMGIDLAQGFCIHKPEPL